jgi:hypothetical protein
MGCGKKHYWAACHNIAPSTIIIDDGDEYFKKTFIQFSLCHMSSFSGWMKIILST